ncbi:MAG TPA: hypothetical protein VF399_05660 [bacterium]
MKLRNKICIGITVSATAVVVAIAMYAWHTSIVKKLEYDQRLSDKNLKSKEMLIGNLKARVTALENEISGTPEALPGDLLKIYSYNAQVNVGTVQFCIWVPNEYSVNQKLKLIVAFLMKYKFNKGMIELMRIEQRGDKKIAIVNLHETKECPFAWKGLYFQGSCGGGETTYILKNTFLQPNYTGAWIHGVEFWYEGEAIKEGDWDHISLHGTMYRK